jgi:glycosyltransferase involved in cell wall biosynthesis
LISGRTSSIIGAVNIVQITPGAGGMYCGNCFRDNALVGALRAMGHCTLMVPLYLPLTLDELSQSSGTPIFFGGVNVFLDQVFPFFRKAPGWLRHWLDSPGLLRRAAGRAAKTRPTDVGELTLSMLRGEEGNQTRELDELVAWLKGQEAMPEVVILSNALLIGLGRRIREGTGAAVVCTLQGEEAFVNSFPPAERQATWDLMAQRARDIDLFIAPSQHYAGVMERFLKLRADQLTVVPNGISLDGYETPAGVPLLSRQTAPNLGYFARMCPEKGLHMLVDAFIALKKPGRVPSLRLLVGGGCGPSDEPFVATMKARLQKAGVLGDCEFHPNLDRASKIAFYRSLDVFSVPALYGEAFGLYLIEAMAAGVPVVQPRHAAFPEIIGKTGGGVLCDPNIDSLTKAIEGLLGNETLRRQLSQSGRRSVEQNYTLNRMAENMIAALSQVARRGT